MKGKEKCKALKELRQRIAEENDIEFAVSECTHQGDCKGTCPKCEAELRYLERELERRTRLGKAVVLAGLSTCLAGFVSGCDGKEEKEPWSGNNSSSTTEWETGGMIEIAGLEEPRPDETEIEILEGDVPYTPEDYDGGLIELEGDTEMPDETTEENTGETTEETENTESGDMPR